MISTGEADIEETPKSNNQTENLPANWEEKLHSDSTKVRRGFWKTLKKAARAIPFSTDLVAAYYCALDSNTPARVRFTLMGALAYFVLPLDTIPDFILGFGFTDDIAVIAAAINAMRGNITDAHYHAARTTLNEGIESQKDKDA